MKDCQLINIACLNHSQDQSFQVLSKTLPDFSVKQCLHRTTILFLYKYPFLQCELSHTPTFPLLLCDDSFYLFISLVSLKPIQHFHQGSLELQFKLQIQSTIRYAFFQFHQSLCALRVHNSGFFGPEPPPFGILRLERWKLQLASH